jgi:hypothetical protein
MMRERLQERSRKSRSDGKLSPVIENDHRGTMRLGIIFAIVMIIILGTILWKRGKPPVP